MRIAILVPNFVSFDGSARDARLYSEELAREGNHVAIFTFATDIKVNNVDVFVMGMPKSSFRERVYRLLFPLDLGKMIRWLPKLKDFDIVIAYLYPLTWLSYLAKKIYKVKYTFRYCGIMDPCLFSHLYERIYMRLQILLTRLTVKNADNAIAVSKFAQKELKKYTGLDSEVIHDRIDTAAFHKGIDGAKIRERHGLGDSPVMLFVGALRPVKGAHLLVQAFSMVKQQVPTAKLVIVGKHTFGYYSKQLRQMLNDSVIFTGFIPDEELPLYYAMCDVYTTCSLWETFNRPLAEAQACGKPVVAFNMGPHPEVIDDNGILVETGNVERFAEACISKLSQRQKAS